MQTSRALAAMIQECTRQSGVIHFEKVKRGTGKHTFTIKSLGQNEGVNYAVYCCTISAPSGYLFIASPCALTVARSLVAFCGSARLRQELPLWQYPR